MGSSDREGTLLALVEKTNELEQAIASEFPSGETRYLPGTENYAVDALCHIRRAARNALELLRQEREQSPVPKSVLEGIEQIRKLAQEVEGWLHSDDDTESRAAFTVGTVIDSRLTALDYWVEAQEKRAHGVTDGVREPQVVMPDDEEAEDEVSVLDDVDDAERRAWCYELARHYREHYTKMYRLVDHTTRLLEPHMAVEYFEGMVSEFIRHLSEEQGETVRDVWAKTLGPTAVAMTGKEARLPSAGELDGDHKCQEQAYCLSLARRHKDLFEHMFMLIPRDELREHRLVAVQMFRDLFEAAMRDFQPKVATPCQMEHIWRGVVPAT